MNKKRNAITFHVLSSSPLNERGRLAEVSAALGGAPWGVAYGYLPGSEAVESLVYSNGLSVLRAFEARGLLTAVSNRFGGEALSRYGYANDAAGRRVSRVDAGKAFEVRPAYGQAGTAPAPAVNLFGYNGRGELTAAARHWGEDPENPGEAVLGRQYRYLYDAIGNRLEAAEGATNRTARYEANALNQYAWREVADELELAGEAPTNVTVSVNADRAGRQGAYWRYALKVTNTAAAAYARAEVAAVYNPPGTNAPDEVAVVTGRLFAAKTPELFDYDADGNLIKDGRFEYAWNGENRLTGVVSRADLPAEVPRVRLALGYDHQGRRVARAREDWDGAEWVEAGRWVFLYDGWNLVEERGGAAGSAATNRYAWGLDLSGTLQGAGGVGGLLGAAFHGGPEPVEGCYTYDGNGNVSELVGTEGAILAHYEYDPFGNTVAARGPLAGANPFRFSTKWWEGECGLCYYGYRWYGPGWGRWASRDPLEERASKSLYAFCDSVNFCDYLGLLVIYIGGAMEGPLNQLEYFKGYVGADKAFEHSHIKKIITAIEEALKKNPCEPIILIGHSWGGDSALDVANELKGDKSPHSLYIVTLDPVSQLDPNSWFGGPYPDKNVDEWINVAQPAGWVDVIVDVPVVGWIAGAIGAGISGIIRHGNGVATGGGQWNSESQATYDIPAVKDGRIIEHHDVDGMINVIIPGKDITVKAYIEKLRNEKCNECKK